ncbi:hypothetical protein Cgig2_013185 [Carnegiea gigantea]|uniref:SWIM-type domain-containing protein n=1 Tax=Carnegiea gigantea TaxID=171969 RepID=A0A9Q1GI84_9CARY|nr:hypothetical protein Cgig2_013185 [Carnegiea gigantea]
MTIGHGSIHDDVGENLLIVNKMARVFRQGKLWSRNRDGNVSLAVGDIFTSKEEFLNVMKDYCVQHGVSLRKIKNTRSRYTQRCINNDYPFKIHAVVLVDKCTWMIRSLNEGHKCPNTQFNKHASSKCVATKLLDEFKDNPNMDKGTMQKTLMRRFGVPDYTCWRVRKLMKNVVEGRHDEGYKGIIKTLKNIMPQASRRICVLHFYKNFASLYPGAWFDCFFYIAANAYSEFVFKKAMDKIKDKDISDFHWLRDNEPLEHWARFKFDQTLKVDDNTNNFVESFNNAIVKHREKPTYTMLEEIRKLIGARFDKRFQISADWDGKVTPFVEKKLKKVELESRNYCNLVPAGRGEFAVREGSTNFTVKLAYHYCDFQRWQVSGIPCKHVARCILSLNHKLDDYCYPWFNVESYRKLYDGIIHPIPDSCLWGESELPALDPPFELRKRGRIEKHKRRKSRLPIPPQLSTIQLSGTKRKKPQQKTGNPVGRPRKIQRLSLASTSTAAASGVPTQSS